MKKRESKFLAFLLRHGAAEFDLKIDPRGWAPIDQVTTIMRERYPGFMIDDLKNIVEHDPKGRYEIEDDLIRARYGHSMEIEPMGEPAQPPEVLYHGTASKNLGRIFTDGLLPMRRQYVHLSPSIEEARKVGSRHSQKVAVLKIRSREAYNSGIEFIQESKTWLAYEIPPEFIEVV